MKRSLSSPAINQAKKNYNIFGFVFFPSLGFSSIFFSFLMVTEIQLTYENMFLIPLFTGIMFLFSTPFVKNLKYNLINIILYVTYFIRNSLTPFILFLTGYSSRYQIINRESINSAVMLMVFDVIVVFSFLISFDNRKSKIKMKLRVKRNKLLSVFIIVGTLLCMFSYFTIPEIRTGYISIFSGELSSLSTSIPTNSFELIMYRFFILIFPMLQVLLPIKLIVLVQTKIGQRFIGVILTLLISLTPLLFVGTTSAFSFILLVTFFFTILEIYPKFRSILFILVGSLSFGGLMYFFWRKIADGNYVNDFGTIASFFQAYFPGVFNIAAAFEIPNSINSPRLLLNDFLAMLPFFNTAFPNLSVYDNSTRLFLNTIGSEGQIMSNLSMSHLHVKVFAPLVNVFLIKIANKLYDNDKSNIYSFVAFTLAAVYFIITPIMYNYAILGSALFKNILWLLLFTKLVNNE